MLAVSWELGRSNLVLRFIGMNTRVGWNWLSARLPVSKTNQSITVSIFCPCHIASAFLNLVAKSVHLFVRRMWIKMFRIYRGDIQFELVQSYPKSNKFKHLNLWFLQCQIRIEKCCLVFPEQEPICQGVLLNVMLVWFFINLISCLVYLKKFRCFYHLSCCFQFQDTQNRTRIVRRVFSQVQSS